MSILAISMPVNKTRKDVVETAKITRAGKDGEENKSNYLENLTRVLCIQ